MMHQVSPQEWHFVATHLTQWEGFVPHAYQDIGGVWTIGYGHTGGVERGDTLTEEDAFLVLVDDWIRHREGVRIALEGAPTTDGQLIALTSLAFNIGVGAFEGSTACQEHIAGNYAEVPSRIKRWNKVRSNVVAGLTRRRAMEAAYYADASPRTEGVATIPI